MREIKKTILPRVVATLLAAFFAANLTFLVKVEHRLTALETKVEILLAVKHIVQK